MPPPPLPPSPSSPSSPSSAPHLSQISPPCFPSPDLVPSDTIAFETGNPETGAIISGTLDVSAPSTTSHILIVESVPGLMTSADFCVFVSPFFDTILHFRPLRLKTERNRYIVLILFQTATDAHKFIRAFQGKLYLRGLTQDTCAIRNVNSIKFSNMASAEPDEPLFPNFEMFPAENSDAVRARCPVCLEALCARTGALVTTFCNHSMHAACLAQWQMNHCPVCRHTHELIPEASTCMTCAYREDLWMCVVCAYVGCGVYKNKHANAHYADTQHPFAINLEECTFWSGEKLRAGSVWDYSSERFVNRLLTSEDGKIVELATEASNSASGADSTRGEACCAAEMGIVEDEDNDRGLQAAVYASRMDAVVDEYRARLKRVEGEHATEKAALDAEMQRVKEELAKSRREKKGLQKKVADLDKEGKRLKEGNGFLKNLYEALLRDKCGWNDEVEKVRKLLKECEEGKRAVEEQLRDVMMHFEAQAKIGAGSESCRSGASELRGGDVLRVGPTPRERLAMRPKRR